MTSDIVDTNNIQGSIWPRLPRYYETFLWFKIKDEDDFKEHLKALVNGNVITTGAQCKTYLERNGGISEAKERVDTLPKERNSFNAVNVCFTGRGVNKLVGTYKELKLRDLLHARGMFQDQVYEGPDDPERLSPEYKPPETQPKGNDDWRSDGMFIIAAQREEELHDTIGSVKNFFHIDKDDASAEITLTKNGHLRNADGRAERRMIPDEKDKTKTRLESLRGKEHFGFEDQISQPQIKGLDKEPAEGEPKAIPAGWILIGHEGDNTKSPKWANDGSFLVFREIEQKVPEFNKFVKEKSRELHGFDDEKLAAYMIGRWKNGSPVELDDGESQAQYPFANNFDYRHAYPKSANCPFAIAAHIRKMRPRGDVDVADNPDVENSNVILRRSITFGPEITKDEENMQEQDKPKRGLYFMCYQADLRNGFNLLTTRWASNKVFSAKGVEHRPGVDPIVSQKNRRIRDDWTFGIYDGQKDQNLELGYMPWIEQKGGEYFFTPSLDALRHIFVDEKP